MNKKPRINSHDIDEIMKAAESTSIAKQAMGIEFMPLDTDIEIKKKEATRIPLNEIASLGVGFASIPEMFGPITQTITIPNHGLLEAFNGSGEKIDINTLSRFKGSQDILGSRMDPIKGFEQVHFKEAGSQALEITTDIPYDPTTLLVAAALMEINKKLDEIQETQQVMFEYLKNKDKAELRGNLETLSDILNNYAFNWDNDTYKNNKHIQVQAIRQNAEQSIIHHRAQIESELDSKGFLHSDRDTKKQLDNMVEELKEYRLAVYLYSFSSFLEVMLLENFDNNYLKSVASNIEDRNNRYKQMYSRCYEIIEDSSTSSIEHIAAKGLAAAGTSLGSFLSKTPVGKHTPVDGALKKAGSYLDVSSDMKVDAFLEELRVMRQSDVKPFVDNINKVNSLYNQPSELLLGEDAVYVLPVS